MFCRQGNAAVAGTAAVVVVERDNPDNPDNLATLSFRSRGWMLPQRPNPGPMLREVLPKKTSSLSLSFSYAVYCSRLSAVRINVIFVFQVYFVFICYSHFLRIMKERKAIFGRNSVKHKK